MFVVTLLLSITGCAHGQIIESSVPQQPRVTGPLPTHPRLILTPQVKNRVAELIQMDAWAKAFFEKIRLAADAMLDQPVIERKLVGKARFRMLDTSRKALQNIVVMGMAYTFAPNERLGQRLIDEMIAIANFEDWHPSHFLDTAEMSMAMALGYDWLYNDMTEQQRQIIRDGIIKHGLEAGMKHDGGKFAAYNWNQVRYGGLTAGALAVFEDTPELAQAILQQAHQYYRLALDSYKGGVYPEGPNYWKYGTSYSCLMSECLQTALGDDWGIRNTPGFSESFDFVIQMVTPTDQLYNFADSGMRSGALPYHMWASRVYGRPDFTVLSQRSFGPQLEKIDIQKFHTHPLALLWYQPVADQHAAMPTTYYVGKGEKVHVAAMRSSWDDDASFIGLKGGMLAVNHGHMDIGSFLIEAHGVRWASDLGMERAIYQRNDSWKTTPGSHRWTFFRTNNFSHNTLTLGKHLQTFTGINPIIADKHDAFGKFTVMDITNAYHGHAQNIQRGIALLPDRSMLVQDDYQGIDPTLDLHWNMMTQASITLSPDGKHAQLKHDKQTMSLSIVQPAEARFSITDATPPTQSEHQNKNFQRLMINLPAPVSDGSITVQFVCGSTKTHHAILCKPLMQWCH